MPQQPMSRQPLPRLAPRDAASREPRVQEPAAYEPPAHEPNIAAVAALVADPARAAMLTVLLDGGALPAGELAFAGGVTAQTASSHLAKLLDGGLLAVETEGRHRYYRLAGAPVAELIEHLAAIIPPGPVRRKAPSSPMREMRFARRCYDHLAGQLGVAVTQGLVTRGYLRAAPEKRFEVTPAGTSWFAALGLDIATLRSSRRGLARQCLDCTERTHHLAGPLGVELLARFCAAGWLRRHRTSRAVELTPLGRAALQRELNVN